MLKLFNRCIRKSQKPSRNMKVIEQSCTRYTESTELTEVVVMKKN